MDSLKELLQIDWGYVLFACGLLLVFIKFLWSLLDWLLFEKLGIETKKMKQRRQEQEQLKATTELANTTADNLSKLQKKHTDDETEFRNSLNEYMEESRKDRKALHEEMKTFTDNRINDRKQSLEIQKELKDSIKVLADGQQERDEKINKLTNMFVDKEIEDMRFDILNFASSISSGKKFNKEAYDHILRIYGKYEKILEEHNMENGLVEESVKYIKSSYQELLQTGVSNY